MPVLTVILIASVISGIVFQLDSAVWKTYTSPLLIEFLAGVWLGYAYQRLPFASLKPLLFVGPLGLIISSVVLPADWRGLGTGVSALATVAGALAFEASLRRSPPRILMLIGNASYSIYLSHMLTLVFVFAVWKRIPMAGWPQFFGLLIFGLIACCAVGIAVHVLVEKPLTKLLSRRRPATVVA